MKTLSVLIVTLLVSTKVFSICVDRSIEVWPRAKEITTNPIFIIEGYGESQPVIIQLNKHNRIYLTAEKDTIFFRIEETFKGQLRLIQSVLRPLKTLTAGKYYSLHIDSLEGHEKFMFERMNFGWMVANKEDKQKPRWQAPPTFKSNYYVGTAEGPIAFANFCFAILDSSPVVALAKVSDLKSHISSEYYVIPDSCYLRLGYNACDATFQFKEGQTYEVTFILMDASGNKSDKETEPIKFISPTPADKPSLRGQMDCNCK